MSKLKIIIAEDEALTAESMKLSLEEKGYEVVALTEYGENVSSLIEEHKADLLILDIALAGKMDGIDTAMHVRKTSDTPFIFLTNINDEKTLTRAAKTNPANYLLKPFTPEQMHISIMQAIRNYADKKAATPGEDADIDENLGLPVIKNSVFLKNTKGYFQKFRLDEILYLKADRTYCQIHIEDTDKIILSTDLKDVQSKISDPAFVRVHRSYVVNIHKVTGLKGNMLLINDDEIPITAENKEKFLQSVRIVR